MRRSFRVLLSVFLLVALSLACSFALGDNPTPTATPVTATVTATNTSAAIQPSLLPSATLDPLVTVQAPAASPLAPAATAGSDVLHFYVSGYVWDDLCPDVDPPPNPLPVGCIFDPIDGLIADGIFSAGEPGIADVTVRIELDCSYGAFTALTDATGFYSMSFTVPASAGVTQQRICLSVDAASFDNIDILIPGWWTFPKTNSDVAVIEITIPVEQQNTVNFGWDYEFD